jgi:hypothetical protein
MSSVLDLLAGRHVGEIDERAVEFEPNRDEDVLAAPVRGHRLRHEILRRFRPLALHVAAQRAEVWSEVGQHLAQAGLGQLGAVEGEAPSRSHESHDLVRMRTYCELPPICVLFRTSYALGPR